MTHGPCGGVTAGGGCEVAPLPCPFADRPTVRWEGAVAAPGGTPHGLLALMEARQVVLADLPGVEPGDVDIRFENGELTLHGRRHPRHGDKTRVRWENESANFHRSFRVSERIAADKIMADLKDGVLKLHLPKAEAAKPRRIAVKGA